MFKLCNIVFYFYEMTRLCIDHFRDVINPYILRRMKRDVENSITLPSKNEQVDLISYENQ